MSDHHPQSLVRLDHGDAAVVEVSGHLEPEGVDELVAVVSRTQRLAAHVVVDLTDAEAGPSAVSMLTEASHGREGCAPFRVLGALGHVSGF